MCNLVVVTTGHGNQWSVQVGAPPRRDTLGVNYLESMLMLITSGQKYKKEHRKLFNMVYFSEQLRGEDNWVGGQM